MKNLQRSDDFQNGSTILEAYDNSEKVEVALSFGAKNEFDIAAEGVAGKKGKTLFCKFCSQMWRF